MNRKLVKKIVFSFITFFILMVGIDVYAADHQYTLKMVKCDDTKYDCTTYDGLETMQLDWLDGTLDSYIINSGDEVDAGTTIMFILDYTPDDATATVTSLQARLLIDTGIWSPIIDSEEFVYFESNQWPSRSSYATEWVYNSSAGTVAGSFIDSKNKPITKETEVIYWFMKLNDAATGSANVKFAEGWNFLTDQDAGSYSLATTDISVTIPGEELSHDATLGSLTVNNGDTTYPSTPTFTAGSSQTEYSYVVPNDTTFINLSATTNHAQAYLLSGGIGNKTLNVGNNSFNITVTAAYGNTETYTINVYRLSNDATLSAINFTNNISVGNMISGQYSYSTTIPYAIKNTVVSATTTHTNAYVDSGLGAWNLPNSDTLSNNRILVVKAENCRSEYASVPGNSCSSQNYNLTINRIAASTNSYLKNLTVDGTSVPGFNKTIESYDLGDVSNSTSKLLLNGAVDDTGKATVSGLGTVNLNVGDNQFTITVTAEDGSKRNYTLNVHRLSNESKLSSLVVTSNPQTSLSPIFSEDFYGDYTYNYDATVAEITVTATVKDTDKAKVVIYDSSNTDLSGLESTLNTQTKIFGLETSNVVVMVTAEDGTVSNYSINLTRAKSTDNTLKSLSINHGTLSPNFASNTKTYTAEVEGSITEVEVNAVPNSLYGKIKSITGNANLKFGNNQIEIVVEAEDKSTSSYIINLTRKEYNIATLDDILIDGVSIPDFNPETFNYRLDAVAFEKVALNIETVKTNSYATVTGDGNISLKTGENTITITVTAQNGVDKNDYVLTVKRAKNDDNAIENLTVKGVTAVNTDIGIYEVTLPNDVTVLTPSDVVFTAPSDSTVDKTLTLPLLTTEVNDYHFIVTSESGNVQVYSIKVTRTKSNDSSISKVTLTIGDDSSRYCLMDSNHTCKIEVPVDTLEFELDASIHSEATINPVNGTSYSMPASESSKTVTLTVTAEDETKTVYTVNVERQKSSNSDLADLKVDGVTVDGFNSSTQTYELTVDGDTDEVMVSATVSDTDKATIVTDLSSPFALQFDTRNKIEVTVKAENNTTKTYTIYITRSHRQDITLSDLTINGITITGFTPTKDDYMLEDLPYNTHQLNIVATPNDNLATKTGDGLVRVNTGNNNITITVTAHDTSITHDYVIHVKRELNNDTSIKGISLAGVEATYNSTTKKYEVTVPNNIEEANTSNLVVTVNDPVTNLDKKASYSFINTPLLTTTTNEVSITVTAEDGTIKIYSLVVTREKSNIATLSSLTVTNGSFNPSFTENTLEYEVTVPVDTTEFDVAAITKEPHANITSGVGHYTMTESSKKVEVVVISEDLSTTNTYILNVIRTKSSINTLSDITVSEGSLSPEFNADTTSYTVNVGGSIDSIDIGATVSDSRATILSGTGTHSLNVGNNPITISVQSESGAKLDYVVTVVRAKKEDNDLTSLTVDGVSVPNFDKDTLEYTLDEVPYTKTSIDIGATLSDSDASVDGTGRKGLITGLNTFEVKVTAQNGAEKIYKIKITRTKNDNANLSLLSVNGYVLAPTFDSETYDYEVTVGATKETLAPSEITAVPEDTNATVVKQETITLSTTVDNYYEVTVTAENGTTTNTYTIKVNRPKSSDATLKEVNVTGATIAPTFEPGKYEYILTVPYGSTNFSIEGIPNVETTRVFGNEDYTISNSVVNLTTQAEDGTTTLVYKFTVVEALSNDATLSSLSVTGYPLDKKFQITTLNYSIGNIPYGTTQLKVNAAANNAASTIEYYVDGVLQDSNTVNIPEAIGTKTITVKVIAADGVASKSYNITYNIVPSSNTYLSNIEPSVGTIDFLKTKTYYELSVDNSVTSVQLTITTEDSNASITVNGESFFTPKTITIDNLVVGNNPVSILVTAQDTTTTNTYNVVIKRLEPVASDDANLSSLSVEGYSLDKEFNMDTLEYSIGKIPFSLTELTIHATPNMGTSTINYLVNGVRQTNNVVSIPKVDGTGAITVQVTAEDGTTVKNYKITYEKEASTNAYLKNIVVSSGELTFNKNTFAYTVNVDRTVASIDITASTEDSKAIMQMNGTTYSSPHTLTISPLASGNTEVTILVTAEDGTVLTYKVTVNKEIDPASTITSVNYGHTITNGYIRTVKLGITGIDMKNQLDNPNEYLEIWTSDETSIVGDNDTLATGMIVKLMIDGVEKDRKFIVIKGDTSGDGEIDLFDAVKILNHYLVRTPLTGAYLEAAYVNDDTDVDLFDSVMILNHYLGRISLH